MQWTNVQLKFSSYSIAVVSTALLCLPDIALMSRGPESSPNFDAVDRRWL